MKRNTCFLIVSVLWMFMFTANISAGQPLLFEDTENNYSVYLKWSRNSRLYQNYLNSLKLFNNNITNEISEISDPYYNSQGAWGQAYDDMWGWKMINIEEAWGLSTGDGVLVAVLDTGLDYTHPEIDDNVWVNESELNGLDEVDDDGNGYVDDVKGWDFHYDDNDVMDGHGHGTHVSGIIAAEKNETGILGAAYNALILPVKMISDYDFAYPDRVAEALRYAADMGARVFNCSWGVPATSYWDPVRLAINYAVGKGCIIVAAAGNDYGEIEGYPAEMDNVITVGSLSPSGTRSSFSNYGPDIDVTAPGEEILSLRAEDTGSSYYFVPQNDSSAEYILKSGTSMAAPYVTSIAALMVAQDPLVTFDDVMRRIKFSSVDKGTSGWDKYYGWGTLDAFKALSYDWYDSGIIKTWWLTDADENNGIKYDYFESGLIKSKLLGVEENGFVSYVYTDTDYMSRGYSRVERAVRSDGSYVQFSAYWGDTENIKEKRYFDPEDNLLFTEKINENGQVDEKIYPDSNFEKYIYWSSDTSSAVRYYAEFGSDYTWGVTLEYWPDGVTLHHKWASDPNGASAGDVVLEIYDASGRIKEKKYDDTSIENFVYWSDDDDSLRYYAKYAADYAWEKTIEYWGDGLTMHNQWVVDNNQGAPGDEVLYIYDEFERMVEKRYDDTSCDKFVYWDNAGGGERRYYAEYDPGYDWQKTIEYWEDGTTMHYQWLKDQNPDDPGDAVFEEYDSNGDLVQRRIDDGTVVTAKIASRVDLTVVNEVVSRNDSVQKSSMLSEETYGGLAGEGLCEDVSKK